MEYLIVEASTREKLQGAVNNNIHNGWKPQGAVGAFYNLLAGYFYMQAMVKEGPIMDEFSKWKQECHINGISDRDIWQAAYSLGLAKGRKEGMEEAHRIVQRFKLIDEDGNPITAVADALRPCAHIGDCERDHCGQIPAARCEDYQP